MIVLTFHYVRCSYIAFHIMYCIATRPSIRLNIQRNIDEERKLYSIFLMLRGGCYVRFPRRHEFYKVMLLTELVGS
jgi:hypothetical protein